MGTLGTVMKHSIMRMNIAAPEELKNLKPTQFDWQFIYPIDFPYL